MKNLPLLIILLFGSTSLYGQNNFKLEDNDLIWQKVYETELSFEEIINNLVKSGIYDQYESYENNLTGHLQEFQADYEGAGYSVGLTPMIISGNSIEAFSTVEHKDGRYRVTLKKIALTKLYDDPFSQQGEKHTLKSVATNRRGKIRDWFLNHSIIYDFTFDQLFTINVSESEDW